MDKKFVMGIAAMAALTLVSCSSDDLDSFSDNSSKNEAISFDGYLGRSAVAVNSTRGSVETKKTLETNGFGVFSTYTGNPASFSNFDNKKVTGQTSNVGGNTVTKWTYTPLKFWPTQGKINFFAYAPFKDGQQLNENTHTFDFTVDKDIAKQIDLLWANAKDKAKTDKEPVKFTFYHALSRIGYTVKLYGDYSSTDATNKANFKLNHIILAGSADGNTPAFYSKATIDLSKDPKNEDPWSNQSSSDKRKFDWISTPQDLNSTTPYYYPKVDEQERKDYLFVIPQDFSEKIGEAVNPDKLYVIVDYTITYSDNTTQTNKVYKKLPIKFERGKAYMLNMTIGLPIEFDVDVETATSVGVDDWHKEPDNNIDSWDDIKHE